jgi:hypothetical protein
LGLPGHRVQVLHEVDVILALISQDSPLLGCLFALLEVAVEEFQLHHEIRGTNSGVGSDYGSVVLSEILKVLDSLDVLGFCCSW